MYVNEHISSRVNEFMSIFRLVLDKLFVQKDHKINAHIIINKLKEKKINVDQINGFMSKLPEGQWNLKIFLDNAKELNDIFGISDEDIVEYSVDNLSKEEIIKTRWKVLVESMLEYSQFATEFYDALKYNDSADLSQSQIKLLNEFMMTFKLIKRDSKKLYDSYCNKRLSESTMKKFNTARIHLEFLLLRILYISLNLKEASDKKFETFAKLLGTERVSLDYQKGMMPRFN